MPQLPPQNQIPLERSINAVPATLNLRVPLSLGTGIGVKFGDKSGETGHFALINK